MMGPEQPTLWTIIVNPVHVALALVVVFFAAMMYLHMRTSGKASGYNAIDMVMTDGKADLDKHVVVFFALLSAWYFLAKSLGYIPKDVNLGGDLIGILMVFLVYRNANTLINKWGNRAQMPAPPNINVSGGDRQSVKVETSVDPNQLPPQGDGVPEKK